MEPTLSVSLELDRFQTGRADLSTLPLPRPTGARGDEAASKGDGGRGSKGRYTSHMRRRTSVLAQVKAARAMLSLIDVPS